jgi:hypothetical protein
LTGSTLVRAHVAQGLVGGKVQNEFSIGLDKIKQNTKKLALAQQLKYGDFFSVHINIEIWWPAEAFSLRNGNLSNSTRSYLSLVGFYFFKKRSINTLKWTRNEG